MSAVYLFTLSRSSLSLSLHSFPLLLSPPPLLPPSINIRYFQKPSGSGPPPRHASSSITATHPIEEDSIAIQCLPFPSILSSLVRLSLWQQVTVVVRLDDYSNLADSNRTVMRLILVWCESSCLVTVCELSQGYLRCWRLFSQRVCISLFQTCLGESRSATMAELLLLLFWCIFFFFYPVLSLNALITAPDGGISLHLCMLTLMLTCYLSLIVVFQWDIFGTKTLNSPG